MRFDLGEGAVLSILAVNETGAVIRLDYGRAGFLFPIGLDARGATELALRRQVRPAAVVMVPHSGGKDSISALFLDAAGPSAVVIPVCAGNPEGDPQAGTLALFEGRTVLRTDERGTIHFITDGTRLWAQAGR
jgi:beta-lactamase superfamily II metal-dependent hydrolase